MQFGQVALAHLLAVASPGPDLAIVLKQSVIHGRRTAVWTSLGIGTGILLHVTYCLLGLALVIKGSPWLFGLLKYAGAAYLAWIGIQALRNGGPKDSPRPSADAGTVRPGGDAAAPAVPAPRAFLTGFLTNAVGNPKATLFFLALFSVVIDPRTPRLIQAAYGVWMAVATAAWFTFVSYTLTHEPVRRKFLRHGHWIDRVLGVVFLGFAVSLAVSSVR